MYLPFFLQSSTCRAVLQLLAVQGEYANMTAPNDPAPPLPKDPYLTSQSQVALSGTNSSPTASLSSGQMAPKISLADQTYQNSTESYPEYVTLGHTASENEVKTESTSGIAQSKGFEASSAPLASTDELFNMCPDRGPAVESEITSKMAYNLIKDQLSSKTISEEIVKPTVSEMVSDPTPYQTELAHSVTDSSARITSTDPLLSSCPPIVPEITFSQRPDNTHSQAEETPLPEPQLAVSTGSPYNKLYNCLFHTCMTPPLYPEHVHTR